MRRHLVVMSVAALCALAACGNDQNKAAAPGTPGAPAAGVAKADAGPAAAQVNCPAQIATPPAEGSMAADIRGVRLGLTYAEAENVVRCSDRAYQVVSSPRYFNVQGGARDFRWGFVAQNLPVQIDSTPASSPEEFKRRIERQEDRVRHSNTVAPGQTRFDVLAVGPQQQERVYAVWFEEAFPEARRPPVSAAAQSLIEKYGEPSAVINNNYYWIYDASGQKVSRGDSGFSRCYYGVRASMNSQPNVSTACGLTIVAEIEPTRENPDIAHSISVVLTHQTQLYEAVQGLNDAAAAAQAARRQQELERAQQSGTAPKL